MTDQAKFLTLTFENHITDLYKANYEFKKFIQRFNYELKIKLAYAVVPEFTQQDRIHYHSILFNMPYIQANILSKIWKNGFIKINKITNVDNVGAYVTKYMTKADDEKLQGQKSYFTSRGLSKPVEIIDEEQIKEIEQKYAPHIAYEGQWQNDYTGQTTYAQYNTKRSK